MVGRNTKLTDELVAKACDYLENYKDRGDQFPSAVGLCKELNIARSTIYDWASQEDNPFSDILSKCNELQERELLNKGITGEFNSVITKLVLGKHGYTDRQESSNTNVELTHEEWLKTLD